MKGVFLQLATDERLIVEKLLRADFVALITDDVPSLIAVTVIDPKFLGVSNIESLGRITGKIRRRERLPIRISMDFSPIEDRQAFFELFGRDLPDARLDIQTTTDTN